MKSRKESTGKGSSPSLSSQLKASLLAPPFDLGKIAPTGLPLRIKGWVLPAEIAHEIPLPPPPPDHAYVVGAFRGEWRSLGCKANTIYLIPRTNDLGLTGETCYDQAVHEILADSSVRRYISAFVPVVSEEDYGEPRLYPREPPRQPETIRPDLAPIVRKRGAKVVIQTATLQEAYNAYEDRCECGEDLGNNCAHYLSNAFIKVGFVFPNTMVKCKKGRPIRAKEFRDWVRGQSGVEVKPNHDSITSGIWFVYQERASDGQGHVCLHKESGAGYNFHGTGDYPDWEVQTHYRF